MKNDENVQLHLLSNPSTEEHMPADLTGGSGHFGH